MAKNTIKNIGIDGLNMLGIDEDNNLYWDKKLVKIEKSVYLTYWQKFGAVLLVIAGCVQAVSSAYEAFFK
ncbi:hypothetical protein JMJ56_31480 [Belnapia sp. T18]|uniref:Uncharacterized protein n=1 Tax=Belnapia arida TaxID=2804533 RepID=A0ABS1UCS1_9PROT|nr:hypothetical protein [Belnapia arida]MBL6082490.1 hypothetical protein [Belnapia arida]